MLCYLMRSDSTMRKGMPIRQLYNQFMKDKNINITTPRPDTLFVPIYDVMKSVGILLLKADDVVSPVVSQSLSFYVFKPKT